LNALKKQPRLKELPLMIKSPASTPCPALVSSKAQEYSHQAC